MISTSHHKLLSREKFFPHLKRDYLLAMMVSSTYVTLITFYRISMLETIFLKPTACQWSWSNVARREAASQAKEDLDISFCSHLALRKPLLPPNVSVYGDTLSLGFQEGKEQERWHLTTHTRRHGIDQGRHSSSLPFRLCISPFKE